MNEFDIWLLAVGLAMDCFAVSITSGILLKRVCWRPMLTMAFSFGFFQAAMPWAGWLGATAFTHLLESIDHWIAFGLLAFLGGRMVIDSLKKEEERHEFDPTRLIVILTLAVATSIDALAVGISFACLQFREVTGILYPIGVIGLVSFLFSLAGLGIGILFGNGIARKLRSELLGGIILTAIGLKILIEHLSTDM